MMLYQSDLQRALKPRRARPIYSTGDRMFLLPKIPKPDVPPKRHVFRLNILHSRFLSRLLPTRHLFSLSALVEKEAVTQESVRPQDATQNRKGRGAR